MQFLHCTAHLPLTAIYSEPATWQASPICRLKRKLSPTLKGIVQLQSNYFYIVLRTLLLAKYARYQSHLCLAKSHQIAIAMSLCLEGFISQKKSLTALMFTVFIYPPTQEFYPHRWRNNFIEMLSWICKKKNFSISYRPNYIQAFHIAFVYINYLVNDSATQILKK